MAKLHQATAESDEKQRLDMRVIGGKAKGRKLLPVPGTGTRPILDRVKTALFDTLRPRLAEAHVADLFAGTGGVGIEALSQGARRCVFVERDAEACCVLRQNLENTQLQQFGVIRRIDVVRFLEEAAGPFDIIYIAPPQYRSLWSQTLAALDARPQILADDALVVVQIDPREYKELVLKHLVEARQKRYGNTLLVYFTRGSADTEDGEDKEAHDSTE